MKEQEIIKGCQRWKKRYQEALVKRYSPMLMTVCRRYAPDDHLAWDILQETFINILHAIPKYKAIGSFEAWMRRIAITTALKYIDRKYWKQERHTEYATDQIIESPIESELNAEDIMQLIQQLPNGFRQIFNLCVIEEYSHKEIANLLGIKESTSRSQLTRARKLLQQLVLNQEKVVR